MPHVVFASAAIRDLQRLRTSLRQKNAAAAKRAGEVILQGIQILGAHPLVGRSVEGLPEPFRDWLIGFGKTGCVVRYHVEGETVTILAVRHQMEADFKS